MRRWKKILLAVLGLLVTAGLVFAIPTVWGKPWRIEHFYARVFLEFALERPMLLSELRILEGAGFDFHNDDLDDFSLAARERGAARVRDNLDTLRSYERAELDDPLSYDVMEWFLADQAEGERFLFHGYPVNQISGVQSQLPDFLLNTHRIDDAEGAEDYVIRTSKLGVAFDQLIEGVRYREERGIVPPRFVMTRVLDQSRDFIAPPAREHVLYTHFADRTAALEDLPAGEREVLLEQLAARIEDTVYPAYERLIAYLAAREPTASTDAGAWKLPEGEAFYAWRLRSSTTTDLSAGEIHRIGLREVERLQAEMKAILRDEGYEPTDFGATMAALGREPRFLYPDTDEGRAQILADYQAILDEIDAGIDHIFSTRPAVGVEVRRVPVFKEATSAGAYYDVPPLDGSAPGVFYANLRNVEEIPRFGMRTLAFHEGIPGHHFQIALAQEQRHLPFFRRLLPFTAYSEGWALYAERVAAENGFLPTPYDRLGHLAADLFRAVRLVVDTGIHAKRWTREQAIAYMRDSTGMVETEVVAEIERYIVWPGQACAYKIGQLEILALREQARQALGAGFDLRGFHDVVLKNGALPLTLLRRVVEDWIERERGA